MVSIDEWEKRSIEILDAHHKEQVAIFDKELKDVLAFTKKREDALLAATEIEQKQTKLIHDKLLAEDKIQEEAQKKRDQLELKLNSQLLQITEAARQQELALIQRALDRQQISEEGAALRQLALLKETHDQRMVLLDLELKQQTTSAERKTELDNEKIKSEQEYTRQVEELTQKRIDALLKEGAAGVPSPATQPMLTGAPVPINVGLPPVQDVNVFAEAIKHLHTVMEDFSSFTANTFKFAIDSLADGIGEAARAWILYGESIGKALRRALAETLATIAAQALIQSLLHAAYALGSLAFGDFGSAARHALAAAKFAAVAAVAGLAGRAAAGSAFSSSSASGSSGGSGGSGSSNNSGAASTQPKPINMDRATVNQNVVKEVLEVRFTGKLGDVIEANWIERYNGGGRLRNVVMTDRDA